MPHPNVSDHGVPQPPHGLRIFLISTFIAVAFLGIGLIALYALLMLLPLLPRSPVHPTDAEMVRLFVHQRSAFEAMVAVIEETPHITQARIRDDWVEPIDGFTAEQLQYFRRQFRDFDLDSGMDVVVEDGVVSVYFNLSSSGLGISGSSKGMVYTTREPTRLVESIDATLAPDALFRYQHIGGHWYLFGVGD